MFDTKEIDEGDGEGWVTEQNDDSFTPVRIPAGWVPDDDQPSAACTAREQEQ